MIEVQITIKKAPGEDIIRTMTYENQEQVMSDADHLIEYLKNYAK